MKHGLPESLGGALLLAALSTLGDFIWAHFEIPHRAAFGLLHGAAVCLALGGFVGSVRGRAAKGALGGVVVGLLAALSFYALAPLLGYAAMFLSWMALWLGLAILDARFLSAGVARSETLARGTLAAVASGLAFYAISGIWTQPNPAGPDYLRHFASWTIAFLPGLLALLARRGTSASSQTR